MLEALGFLQSVIAGLLSAILYDLTKTIIRRFRH